MNVRIFAIAAATVATFGSANAQQTADDHLGTVHFPISCSAVQAKFDRAVALLHNFYYPETVKAFQAVIQDDPAAPGDERAAQPAGAALSAGQPEGRIRGNPAG
jgi:hypothetical protein